MRLNKETIGTRFNVLSQCIFPAYSDFVLYAEGVSNEEVLGVLANRDLTSNLGEGVLVLGVNCVVLRVWTTFSNSGKEYFLIES